MQPLAPMLLAPIAKSRAWGGHTFVQWGKFAAPAAGSAPIGESWELADLPDDVRDGCSGIQAGAFAGRSLREALRADERGIMGRARLSSVGRFPLLVKFLDAAEHLSVQVHPTPAFAEITPGAHVKSESWIVLHAEPGARIWRGVRPSVHRDEFERCLRTGGDVVPLLVEVPVRAGDRIDLPSGLCHALGGGITVAEVQTPSDTTYRVFDWNRNDPARPLHVAQAMACTVFGAAQQLERYPVENMHEMSALHTRQFRTTLVSATEHYRIERVEATEAADLPVITHQRPCAWMVLAGRVRFDGPTPFDAGPWRTVLVPASAEGLTAHLDAGTVLLRAAVPDPMDRWMA
jgi:mannose-6-phosphate isomerase